MIPDRLINPTVGLIPTMECCVAGLNIEPDVSVPTDTMVRLAATAAAEPVLEPPGKYSPYGFNTCPPLALYPAHIVDDIPFASSVIFVLPRITAPASLSFWTRNASFSLTCCSNARVPALVLILSLDSMFAFNRTGMPCKELLA